MELRRRLIVAVVLMSLMILIAATGYVVLSPTPVSLLDAVYMAVVTLSGVGYGEIVKTDHAPHLRLFNMFVVIFGIMIAIYAFSSVTAFFVEGEIRNLFRRRRMQRRISELKDHYILCGLGATGRHAAVELYQTGTPFCVIDASEDAVQRSLEHMGPEYKNILYITGDATDEETLVRAGVDRAAGIIAALSADKDNLVVCVIVHQRNPSIRIVARCIDPKFSPRVLRAGANSVISPNQIGGLRMAHEVMRPHVVSFLDFMVKDVNSPQRIEEIVVHDDSKWIGKNIGDLHLRRLFGVRPLSVKYAQPQEGRSYEINPPDSYTVSAGDVIIVLGATADV
ncbi:MAG TPA: potassium channel protein, partial [Terriglobales bacterium]